MTLLERIEKHLKVHHISATRFGRRAVGDPRFVLDLRQGRRPRRRTIERLEAYLQSVDGGDAAGGIRSGARACEAADSEAPRPARVLPRPSRQPLSDGRSSTK